MSTSLHVYHIADISLEYCNTIVVGVEMLGIGSELRCMANTRQRTHLPDFYEKMMNFDEYDGEYLSSIEKSAYCHA
eukprot:CAMPEP_0196572948 /NCGR_PEP_ID=MMETSP1081-20130531/2916_1 /TAXON_ID=36882 /ORGANISM="Pyramimonas amylifera, Strain CCMP720" /LENGTH=75 /DNA_ID=CAMNT_0041890463 /DNA_START=35 /DNA_END=259 /DNA_ORIENTATION=+